MPFPWKFPYVFWKYRHGRNVQFNHVPDDLVFAPVDPSIFTGIEDSLVFTRSE